MRTVRALRIDCIEKTLRQDIAFFDGGNTGSTAIKITTNASLVQQGMAEKLGLIVQAVAAMVTAFIVALSVQWKLALITICILPAIVITTGISIAIDASQEAKCMTLYAKAGTLATEVFSSIRLVHAYWSQPRMIERHNKILDDAKIWGILYANEFFFVFAGYALAFWQGIRMYASGEIEAPGKIITYVDTLLQPCLSTDKHTVSSLLFWLLLSQSLKSPLRCKSSRKQQPLPRRFWK
jgi:ATP-binding cassette subfamily B (MDR/TAP) protein 1